MAFLELKNLFSIGKRDKVLADINETSKGFVACGEARCQYGDSWAQFGQKAALVATSQNSEIQAHADELAKEFGELGAIMKRLGTDESRNGEDFRDIMERYEVLFRTNENYIQCKYDYKQACDALTAAIAKNKAEEVKPNYAKSQAKLLAAIEKCRTQKRTTLDKYKASIRDLIEQREKYNKFKVRRLCEGWTRYGLGLKRACDEEAELLSRMQSTLNEFKGISPSNQDNLNRTEAVQESPAPVQQSAGYAAPAADTGYTGYAAPAQDTGYSGYQAPAADTGYQAPVADSGYTGYQAPADTGYTGYQAPAADSGYQAPADTGYSGYQAPADTGYSGYQAPADTGYTGYQAPADTTQDSGFGDANPFGGGGGNDSGFGDDQPAWYQSGGDDASANPTFGGYE